MSNKVTIAQALRRIKKLKGQLAEHTSRATAGVSYVQDKVPAFRFREALQAMDTVRSELLDLEARVAVANAKKTVVASNGDKLTLTHAIRQLQELKGEIAFFRGLNLRAETVREKEVEWNDDQMKNLIHVTEVVYVSDLTEQDRDLTVRALQDEFEALNNKVEEANHTVLV